MQQVEPPVGRPRGGGVASRVVQLAIPVRSCYLVYSLLHNLYQSKAKPSRRIKFALKASSFTKQEDFFKVVFDYFRL